MPMRAVCRPRDIGVTPDPLPWSIIPSLSSSLYIHTDGNQGALSHMLFAGNSVLRGSRARVRYHVFCVLCVQYPHPQKPNGWRCVVFCGGFACDAGVRCGLAWPGLRVRFELVGDKDRVFGFSWAEGPKPRSSKTASLSLLPTVLLNTPNKMNQLV